MRRWAPRGFIPRMKGDFIVEVETKKISPDAKDLSYAHEGDSGVDLYSTIDIVLKPMQIAMVPTGLQIAIPQGYEAQIRPKSGLAANSGITVLNTPGTIDAGYRGEVKVILINLGNAEYRVEKGKKIAQLVFAKVEHARFAYVEELDKTSRGSGGFGSTGLH